MKVLYITNLFPLSYNPEIGIFITDKLKAYKCFNIDFEVYCTISTDTFGSRVFRKIIGSKDGESLGSYYEVKGIRYNYISFKRRFRD